MRPACGRLAWCKGSSAAIDTTAHWSPRVLVARPATCTPMRPWQDSAVPRAAVHVQRYSLSKSSSRCVSVGLSGRPPGAQAAPPPGLLPEPWTGAAYQEQSLVDLRRRLQAGMQGCPDDATLKWFLRDRRFDVDEAASKLASTLRWRREFLPTQLTLDMVEREFTSGKAFVHTHSDVYNRPVVVVRAKLHVTGQYPSADSKRLCVYLIDQAIQALPPGGEQILGVFDLRGFGLENADFDFARFMVEAFFEFYPRRVSQVLFVDAPWLFRPAWEAIKPLMRKYSALVRFVTVQELCEEYFTPQTVPPGF